MLPSYKNPRKTLLTLINPWGAARPAFLLVLVLTLGGLCTCGVPNQNTTSPTSVVAADGPKYSLAQWSFNRELFAGKMTTEDFITAAGEMGFSGVEYVSQFFQDKVDDHDYLGRLKTAASLAGVRSLLIMVDGAGNLGASNASKRKQAVAAHKKWVLAAKFLGCPAIRINAHGDGTPEEIKQYCLDGIGQLADFANQQGIQIIIENHGGISNNGAWLADLVRQLQDKKVGTLPDFDNWCTARSNGQLWGGECTNRYPAAQGLLELMPYAEAVSVKSFEFDENGNETSMDFGVFFDIIRGSGYDGYLGIEYEGKSLSSREGIEKTRALAARSWQRQQIVTKERKQRITASLKSFIDQQKVIGVSALIYEKGKEVYSGAYGYADLENGEKMRRDNIALIYSMTKPITGVALMQLYEQGKFKLDDPLSKYLPEFAKMSVYKEGNFKVASSFEAAKRPITIRDLTRHTAGFYNGGGTDEIKAAWRAADVFNPADDLTTRIKKIAAFPLVFHPGAQWAYGPAVDVQARLVEVISGFPFDVYLRINILDPLKMKDTRYFVPEEDRPRMAAVYQREQNGTFNRLHDFQAHAFNIKPQALKPGGYGLTSTLDDYQRFARMLVNGGSLGKVRILKPETVQLMRTNHLSDSVTERMWLPSKGKVGFGIDFAVRLQPPAPEGENLGAVGEFFWDGAASTLFWVDPANELTAVLFVQLFPYDQVGLHRGFREAVYGE